MRLTAVACWLVLALGIVAVRYPDAFRDANATARANASLDVVDRELGGGNSVLPDQGLMLEARGHIPVDGRFRVAVGERRPEWSDLTAPFGGMGISGIGREGGDYALDFYSDLKTLQILEGSVG